MRKMSAQVLLESYMSNQNICKKVQFEKINKCLKLNYVIRFIITKKYITSILSKVTEVLFNNERGPLKYSG